MSEVVINNSNFYCNVADTNGGAIKTTKRTVIIVSQSIILSNNASYIGGGIYSSLYTQTHHYPLEFYGAIISLNSKLVILDSTFEGSQTQFTGGAIYTEKNDLVMVRCNFSHSAMHCLLSHLYDDSD